MSVLGRRLVSPMKAFQGSEIQVRIDPEFFSPFF